MKKIGKVFLIIINLILLFCTFNNNFSYATLQKDASDGGKSLDPSEDWVITETIDPNDEDWVNKGTDQNGYISGDWKLDRIARDIIGPIQVIGSLVSVIAIIIIGIRYMLGSVEEKAQYKETLLPYLLGAVFVFGIVNILQIIYSIAKAL